MGAVENIVTYLLDEIKTQDVVRVSASEAEYLNMAPGFPGKLEYHNGEIIAVRLASIPHELIVMAIGRLLSNYYFDKDFAVTGSNAGLQISQADGSYYQPDLMVTQGAWQFKPGSTPIITNPYMLVEVLSKGTQRYDREDKLPLYKDVPSLHYLVYAAQDRSYLTVYRPARRLAQYRLQNPRQRGAARRSATAPARGLPESVVCHAVAPNATRTLPTMSVCRSVSQ